MARLGSLTLPRFGNTGPSSLIRSANSLATSIAANEDAKARLAYETDHSDAGYTVYSDYLRGRMSHLLSTGSVVDNTRATTMAGTLESAMKQNLSFNISNASIAVLAGTGTKTDKYNLLSQYYVQAAQNGDVNLAQSLEGQAYTLSQQIQYDQQKAADAATSLAKAGASSTVSAEKGAATSLIDGLRQFNNDYAHSGQKNAQATLDAYVKKITPELNAAGVHLTPGMSLNAYSVAQGVSSAVLSLYTMAHDAVAPYDPSSADAISTTASNFLGTDGQGGNIPTLGGKMNYTTLVSAITDPNRFSYKADPDFVGNKGQTAFANQNPQTGFKFDYTKDSKGNPVGVVPVYSQQAWVNVPMKVNDVANKLGLQIIGGADGNAIQVAAKKESPDWVKKILPANATTHLLEDAQGNINLEADSSSGQGMAKYLIQGNISGGKYNVFEWGANGYTHITQIGLNNSDPGSNKGGTINLPNGQVDHLAGVFGNLNRLGGASNMVANAGIKEQQVSAETAAAAKAMLAYTPPPLPNISTAPPPATPNISQSKGSVAMPTIPVAPKTVNPQPGGISPQKPGGFNLQGGGFNLQGGGGGIRL